MVNFPFTPSAAGTYNIWIATDSKGENVINWVTTDATGKKIIKENTTLTIKSGTGPSLDLSGVGFAINKNYAGFVDTRRSIWGNTFDVNVTGIKNNGSLPIKTTFTIWLREYDKVTSSS